MLNQQAAQAIAIAADLPLYVRLHWLAMGRVDHAGHVHLMPSEAADLLAVAASRVSKAIAALTTQTAVRGQHSNVSAAARLITSPGASQTERHKHGSVRARMTIR